MLEGTETGPEKKLESTSSSVVRHLETDHDAGNAEVHLWLSFSFVL